MGKCDCKCVTESLHISSNINGALCEKQAFDQPAEPAIGRGFCGVVSFSSRCQFFHFIVNNLIQPAISTLSPNTFEIVEETVKTFFVIPGKMTWDEAVDTCYQPKYNGRLASVRSYEENAAVQKSLNECKALFNTWFLLVIVYYHPCTI